MNAIHLYLGLAVLVLNAAAGGVGLTPSRDEERFWGLAALAHGGLVVQVITGFFLFTSTVEGPGALHVGLPIAGLAGVIGARRAGERLRVRATAVASLLVATLGLYALYTGLTHE